LTLLYRSRLATPQRKRKREDHNPAFRPTSNSRKPSWGNLKKLREHENWKILSPDQLFLGIMKSPRPAHLITALTKMGDLLAASSVDSAYPRIERVLDSLFRRRLSVPELADRVRIAGRLQLPLPTGRKRTHDLSWLDELSEAVMALFTEIVTGAGVT
jgi:hypothetical protein